LVTAGFASTGGAPIPACCAIDPASAVAAASAAPMAAAAASGCGVGAGSGVTGSWATSGLPNSADSRSRNLYPAPASAASTTTMTAIRFWAVRGRW
jgi:hypothetical protein